MTVHVLGVGAAAPGLRLAAADVGAGGGRPPTPGAPPFGSAGRRLAVQVLGVGAAPPGRRAAAAEVGAAGAPPGGGQPAGPPPEEDMRPPAGTAAPRARPAAGIDPKG